MYLYLTRLLRHSLSHEILSVRIFLSSVFLYFGWRACFRLTKRLVRKISLPVSYSCYAKSIIFSSGIKVEKCIGCCSYFTKNLNYSWKWLALYAGRVLSKRFMHLIFLFRVTVQNDRNELYLFRRVFCKFLTNLMQLKSCLPLKTKIIILPGWFV